MITHIDKTNNVTQWTLSEVMATSLSSSAFARSSSKAEPDPDNAKFQQRLLDKLKYCKEVLGGIMTATAEAAAVPRLAKANVGQAILR
jgi:cell cycle serine/threonine-protein kinase CDC5/MSD2